MALEKRYQRDRYITPEEYLELDRQSDVRLEYIDGVVRAMAGEDPQHNQIAGNIYRGMGNAFETSPCYAYMEGVRVQVSASQYRYPDVVAFCGAGQYADTHPPTLLNPQVVVEVLSGSTSEVDETTKLREYRECATITDYVVVAQTVMQVVHHTRSASGEWETQIYVNPDEVVRFSPLDFAISLADIYRKVVFPPAEPEAETESS